MSVIILSRIIICGIYGGGNQFVIFQGMFSGSFKEGVFIAEDNQRFAVLLEKLIKRGFLKNSGIQEPISTDELCIYQGIEDIIFLWNR